MTRPASDPAIAIDRERCMGSGSCLFHAPATFDIDDAMKAVLLDGDGDGDPPDAVRAAVEGCPSRALSFHDPPA
ncbi:MAG: ferredoxin [Streptomycetaceae bacterium]|nr:ferredoxin [Streptomycetaceae bacterium]